jgi:hypothetical protein
MSSKTDILLRLTAVSLSRRQSFNVSYKSSAKAFRSAGHFIALCLFSAIMRIVRLQINVNKYIKFYAHFVILSPFFCNINAKLFLCLMAIGEVELVRRDNITGVLANFK